MANVSAARNTSAPSATTAARSSSPNAILSRYRPTGASAVTARQDRLPGGVASSHTMARTDLPKLRKYEQAFEAAGAKYGLPPALLAAIASRESRGGSALDRNGRGDGGNGFGLMQIDFRYHNPRGGPYSAQHIDQAAGILKGMLNEVKRMHPNWPPEQQLRGAVVAYNSGTRNVQTIAGMDRGTTGNDYSNDVWARAQALAPHFGGRAGSGGTDRPSTRPSGGNGDNRPRLNAPTQEFGRGTQGAQVERLQKALVKLGYMTQAEMNTGPGTFGPRTEAALKEFQAKSGVPSTGFYGDLSEAALGKALARQTARPKDGFDPPNDKRTDSKGGSKGVDGTSARGREQMRALMAAAERNSGGKRPQGWCLREVGDILERVDYGNIGRGKAPRFPYARNFAEWLNKPGMADKMGLRKLNINNPYDAPPGAIVVVRPGSPGTRHPTAGDIAIAMGKGRFLNDGEMGYGGRNRFPRGNDYVLGVYVPK